MISTMLVNEFNLIYDLYDSYTYWNEHFPKLKVEKKIFSVYKMMTK